MSGQNVSKEIYINAIYIDFEKFKLYKVDPKSKVTLWIDFCPFFSGSTSVLSFQKGQKLSVELHKAQS